MVCRQLVHAHFYFTNEPLGSQDFFARRSKVGVVGRLVTDDEEEAAPITVGFEYVGAAFRRDLAEPWEKVFQALDGIHVLEGQQEHLLTGVNSIIYICKQIAAQAISPFAVPAHQDVHYRTPVATHESFASLTLNVLDIKHVIRFFPAR